MKVPERRRVSSAGFLMRDRFVHDYFAHGFYDFFSDRFMGAGGVDSDGNAPLPLNRVHGDWRCDNIASSGASFLFKLA